MAGISGVSKIDEFEQPLVNLQSCSAQIEYVLYKNTASTEAISVSFWSTQKFSFPCVCNVDLRS